LLFCEQSIKKIEKSNVANAMKIERKLYFSVVAMEALFVITSYMQG